MEEIHHNDKENQHVSELREDYIDKVLASKDEHKSKSNRRVIRIIVISLFILLVAVVMLPILFAVLLWIATLFA